MLAGYFMQVAHLERTGHYLTVKDNQVSSSSSSIPCFNTQTYFHNLISFALHSIAGGSFAPIKLSGPQARMGYLQ